MIGVYDYTVILTYLSTCSGLLGIIFTMTEVGHPYCGTLFLMISGLLDGFDGKVARTKQNRTDLEKRFGISFDEEFFDTVNGFMISKMDRIPEVGDQFSVEVGGYLFQIMKVKNHKIDKVIVKKQAEKNTLESE